MDKTFIFDYDDTLAPNHFYYEIAKIKFVQLIVKNFFPDVPELGIVLGIQQKIDKELVAQYGFGMERFPTSLVKTYEKLCSQAEKLPRNGDLQEVYDIGMRVFDVTEYERQGLMQGAEETLDFLASQDDELLMLTKGDSKIQNMKIKATNMAKWFSLIYITPKKDADEILRVVGSRDKSKVWHVGNLIKSDVEPALAAGINAIYIPLETWSYEADHNGLPQHPNLRVFNDIIDIKHNYSELS